MITRESNNTFQINIGGRDTEVVVMADLVERLRASGYWSDERLTRLTLMQVGDTTLPVTAYYVIDGIRHASLNGVVGKPL
jgi:hypothetical protein